MRFKELSIRTSTSLSWAPRLRGGGETGQGHDPESRRHGYEVSQGSWSRSEGAPFGRHAKGRRGDSLN